MRHGKGIFKDHSGIEYSGQWVMSQKEGKGIQIWPNGDKYEGHFAKDKMDGEVSYLVCSFVRLAFRINFTISLG